MILSPLSACEFCDLDTNLPLCGVSLGFRFATRLGVACISALGREKLVCCIVNTKFSDKEVLWEMKKPVLPAAPQCQRLLLSTAKALGSAWASKPLGTFAVMDVGSLLQA